MALEYVLSEAMRSLDRENGLVVTSGVALAWASSFRGLVACRCPAGDGCAGGSVTCLIIAATDE